MTSVTILKPRADTLVIERRSPAWGLLAVVGVWAAVTPFLSLDTGAGLTWLLLGAAGLPGLVVHVLRSFAKLTRVLVRGPGRLVLDGEPLDLARVELKVEHWPLFRVPRGFSLSLWVMTASGPEDVGLGRFASLLDASKRSGTLEDFISLADRQRGRTGV
jgi:hypothetical protein